jgi:hypothetical protein
MVVYSEITYRIYIGYLRELCKFYLIHAGIKFVFKEKLWDFNFTFNQND